METADWKTILAPQDGQLVVRIVSELSKAALPALLPEGREQRPSLFPHYQAALLGALLTLGQRKKKR